MLPSLFFSHLSVVPLTVLDHLIGIRQEALQKYNVLVLWMLPSRIGGERFARTSSSNNMLYTRAIDFKPILLFGKHTVFLWLNSLLSCWDGQWKPIGILFGESFLKGDDSSGEQGMASIPTLVQGAGFKDYISKPNLPEEAPSAPRSV